jgi:hypothetical protein
MMLEKAQLKVELLEARKELQRLWDSLTLVTHTRHKDLSLGAVIPKFARTDSTITIQEFLAYVESTARLGNWTDEDK